MKERLSLMLEELVALKAEGVSHVYCEEGTLGALKDEVGALMASLRQDFGGVEGETNQDEVKKVEAKKETVVETSLRQGSGRLPPRTLCEEVGSRKKKMPEAPVVELPEGDKKSQWEWLRNKVLECPVCKSHVKEGKQVVFGAGDLDADIFFCGEAPGADEEVEGEPFVGDSGKLLMKIIQAMGLKREQVYLTNVMNWHPETSTHLGSRPPTKEEMEFCLPYLKAQVEIVKPKVIVALGATAVNGLLGVDSKRRMGEVRGTWHEFEGRPMMITFHPSYLLRNNTNRTKRMVWEDMLKVMERLGMKITEKQRAYFS